MISKHCILPAKAQTPGCNTWHEEYSGFRSWRYTLRIQNLSASVAFGFSTTSKQPPVKTVILKSEE